MKTAPITSVLSLLVFIQLQCHSGEAVAAPPVGGARPDVTLVDAWERPLVLRKTATKPVLVVYEDSASSKENVVLKSELSELAKGGAYRARVVLLAVADVSGYDFFPAKGFAKSAIRGQSTELGTPIYCDWTGSVRVTLGLEPKRSNVVLYGRDGRVRFSHAGPLGADKRKELLGELKEMVK